ncbi:MAG: DNA mismatch repair protein, partial [Dysgonamonadaceae bacterium]|nr:DNA mismatch repair protein [Dysgonamonadaceae bacterium]
MNSLKFNLCLIFLAIAFSSCSKEEVITPELTISKNELSFGKDAYSQELVINTNVPWSVSSSEAWCTVSPASGGAGTSSIDVSVAGNTTVNPREAILTVTAEGLTQQVKIKQISIPLIITGDKEHNIAAAGKTISFTIESSGEYKVEVSNSWIIVPLGSSTRRDFVIEANSSLAPREGTITFTLGSFKEVITIKQAGTTFDIPNDKTGMESNAITLASKMYAGWNIGNTLEAIGGETAWGNPKITEEYVKILKSYGFNAIRIP